MRRPLLRGPRRWGEEGNPRGPVLFQTQTLFGGAHDCERCGEISATSFMRESRRTCAIPRATGRNRTAAELS